MLLHAAPCALGRSVHLWTLSSYPEWLWSISISVSGGPQRYISSYGHYFFHVSLKLELDWAAHLRQWSWRSISFVFEKRDGKYTVCFDFVNMIWVNMHLCLSRPEVYYIQIMTSSINVLFIYGDTDSILTVSFKMWKSLFILSVGLEGIRLTTSQWDFSTRNRDFTIDLSLGASFCTPTW